MLVKLFPPPPPPLTSICMGKKMKIILFYFLNTSIVDLGDFWILGKDAGLKKRSVEKSIYCRGDSFLLLLLLPLLLLYRYSICPCQNL